MFPIEIHDRGRGPELKGTRITVFDIIPYRLAGDSAERIATVFRTGYPELTAEHIEALIRYWDENRVEVMAVHEQLEARVARGNPAEVEAKLAENRSRMQARIAGMCAHVHN